MTGVLEHIAAWEAAGVIDEPTAARLRAVEGGTTTMDETASPEPVETAPSRGAATRSGASAMFGPSVTIAEVFGYLGGAFLLAAWTTFMGRTMSSSESPETGLGFMCVIAVVVLGVLGLLLQDRDERSSRAAGVAFLLAATYSGAAAAAFASAAGMDWPESGIVASGVALSLAVVLRTVHPAVLTQVGVLAGITALSGSGLAWLQKVLFPDTLDSFGATRASGGVDPLVLVVASAVWWLTTAVIIALIGLREDRIGQATDDPAAGRRAGVSRFWAGIVAVVGLWSAVSRSGEQADGAYGRILEPWVGAASLLILSAVLVERAFRRDATSFIYAAALGLIVALTDINVSYLSDSAEAALVVEGLILLGVGYAADRLRRRVGQDDSAPPAPVTDPVLGEAATPT